MLKVYSNSKISGYAFRENDNVQDENEEDSEYDGDLGIEENFAEAEIDED